MKKDQPLEPTPVKILPVKILLVDDSEIVRSRLRNIFESSARVNVVGDTGDSSLVERMVENLQPDIVVLDVRMPERTGIDVARSLRRENANVKIAMLTNYFDPMTIDRCKQAGADYVFDKSSEFELFTQYVELLAERRVLGEVA